MTNVIALFGEDGSVPEWTLADRLRKAREAAGLEQSELSNAARISRATISAAENGHRRPSRSVIALWAMATGVSYDWIVGDEPDEPLTIAEAVSALNGVRGEALIALITAAGRPEMTGAEDAAAVLEHVARREAEVQARGDWQSSSAVDQPELVEWCNEHRPILGKRLRKLASRLESLEGGSTDPDNDGPRMKYTPRDSNPEPAD